MLTPICFAMAGTESPNANNRVILIESGVDIIRQLLVPF